MFPCYGCHYMQRIFKTPWLRLEYVIKASSFWPLRGNFLIQLLPLEYTRSRAVRTHEELELATEVSPGTGIFPPLGLHILTPVLFYSFTIFLYFVQIQSANQLSACPSRHGPITPNPLDFGYMSSHIITPKEVPARKRKVFSLAWFRPIFCLMRENWNYLVLPWKGLDGEALFGARS